eukprot:m.92350 g.92350  ORF g.92350 m.92350 type:complete len:55 (+) comp26539_c1_seq2:221-385(+)
MGVDLSTRQNSKHVRNGCHLHKRAHQQHVTPTELNSIIPSQTSRNIVAFNIKII